MGVLAAALAGLIVVNLVVFVLLLASSRRRVRGGQLDLTAAAARGELAWDWPLINTETHAHPGTWCSPDYCGHEWNGEPSPRLRRIDTGDEPREPTNQAA